MLYVRETELYILKKKKVYQFQLIFYEETLELKYFQSSILIPSLESP